MLERRLGLKLLGAFALGGLQGAIGWWMVTSGLVDRTSVSPYRLTIHLGLAFLLFGLMFWIALGLLASDRKAPAVRSEEHTSELQSLMRISYAVFCLKKKTTND